MRSRSWLAMVGVVVGATVLSAGTARAEAVFEALPLYPGGEGAGALGVSRDGSAVVGQAMTARPIPPQTFPSYEGALWRNGQITALGDLDGPDDQSAAFAASSDGSVIVGGGNQSTTLPNPNGTFPPPTTNANARAVRWVNGVISPLETSGAYRPMLSTAVSMNGSVIAGEGINTIGQTPQGQPITRFEAFRWSNGVTTPLGVLPGGDGSRAEGISADGSVIIGQSFATTAPGNGDHIFRWENGVMTELPIGGGLVAPYASGISADGRVVVGYGFGTSANQPFRLENGVTQLLSGYGVGGFAEAVSGDGSVIVGAADLGNGAGTSAFIWDAAHGMRSLKDVLQNEYGIDLTGWNLFEARAVSEDGRTIVGTGSSPTATNQAFKVTLPVPEPAALSLVVPAALAILRRRPRGAEAR